MSRVRIREGPADTSARSLLWTIQRQPATIQDRQGTTEQSRRGQKRAWDRYAIEMESVFNRKCAEIKLRLRPRRSLLSAPSRAGGSTRLQHRDLIPGEGRS